MDSVEEVPEDDLSFHTHPRHRQAMESFAERDIESAPHTPRPPFTPPSHSPPHYASFSSHTGSLEAEAAAARPPRGGGGGAPSSSSALRNSNVGPPSSIPHTSPVDAGSSFFPHMESPEAASTRSASAYASPTAPQSPIIHKGIKPPQSPVIHSGNKTPQSPGLIQNSGSRTPQSPLIASTSATPRTPFTLLSPRFLSPIGTPVRKAVTNMKSYLEEIGHLTKFNPQDAWLPITESRTGNAFYATFHNLNAGIGFQGLILPFAMFYLGWTWGIFSIIIAYLWQLYTMWILTRLHEAIPGIRHSRYVQLAQAAFGNRLGYWLATPPNIYLTAGTATALMVVGGSALKLFYKIICGPECGASPLTTIEWYLVFAMLSAVLAQLPNLNSIAGLSLVGAITAVIYCTMLWTLSISRERPPGVSYTADPGKSATEKVFLTLNALGIVAFSFRGHNLAMEIQATMPSTLKHPAHVPMWRGTKVANAIVAVCYFPIAIAGYWAYGSKMLSGGILFSIYAFHQSDISRALMGLLFILVVINCLSSFQIYSFVIFDSFEAGHTAKRNRPIAPHVRVMFRIFYVFTNFLIAAAFPWLPSLSGLLGGLSSAPVTFAYPCFMWLAIMKPKKYSFKWYLNWSLGVVGMLMAVAFSAGGIWSIVDSGIKLHFFRAS